jgi:hypothetical protein
MIPMKRDDVFKLCQAYAPIYHVDPLLFLALCEQESVDMRDPTIYHEDAIRLEQGYLKYVRLFDPLMQSLLSTSWGLTQMMGDSLRQVGFFLWHRQSVLSDDQRAALLLMPTNVAIAYALIEYAKSPAWQVRWGVKFFDEIKHQDLLKWNGGGDPLYPTKVLARRANLLTIYGGTQ